MNAPRWTLCHTGDWHLGQSFYGRSRREEHQAFLAHLTRILEERRVDVLVIAGDVFDNANPSGEAQTLFFDFLSETRRRVPTLEVLVIAGNHDSAARLGAPASILASLGIRVVTKVAYSMRGRDEALDASRLVHRLVRENTALASFALVPFLRPSDLPSSHVEHAQAGEVQTLEESVRAVYSKVRQTLEEGVERDETRVAIGHVEIRGAVLSQASERAVMGGHGVSDSVFGAGFDYVALGHLHLGQICGSERVAYSGSPIPLSFQEADYEHAVRVVEFEGRAIRKATNVRVPHARRFVRVPGNGVLSPREVLEEISGLEKSSATLAPWAEVRVQLQDADPGLRKNVEAALRARGVELLKLNVDYSAPEKDDAVVSAPTTLWTDARELFREKWRVSMHEEPTDVDLTLFSEALELAQERRKTGAWTSAGELLAPSVSAKVDADDAHADSVEDAP